LKEAQGLNAPDVTVAALKSSTSQAFVEELLPLAQRKLTGSYDEALELLFSGKVDIIVADYPFCALTAYRFHEKGLIAGGSPLSYEPLGIALPEDTLLINWVRNFLVTLQGSGRLKKMTNKWLQGGTWVEQLP
jgi:polar amino acid transport system substrate-binding protein